MKKYILLVCCIVSLLGVAWAAGKVSSKPEKLTAPQPQVTFNGKTFYLQYSEGSSQMWLNEYLPAGQNFDTFTEMIALRSYDTVQATPMQLAQMIAGNYAQQYPGVKYLLASNPKTGDGLISYIMIEGNILEFNLFRTTMQGKMPVSLQYVYRKYLPTKTRTKEDLSAFGKETSARRTEWINALDNMAVPAMVRVPKK